MGVTQQQVISLLENVLFESATQAAANAATWQSNAAATSVSSLATAMAGSGEEKIAATVVGYYITSLGRAPTAVEVHYYTAIAEQGLTTAQISAGDVSNGTWDTIASYFSHSPEFASRAGLDYSLGTTGALLEAVPFLYESVLGRTPGGAEISYYDNQILSGSDLGVLFREFTASPEFHTDTDSQIATALANYGTDVASGLTPPTTIGSTVELGPPTPTPTPTPSPTPTPAPSYAFTTGTDTFITNGAGHDYTATLGGTSPTLTPGDTLTGVSNTLTITDTSGAASQDILPTGLNMQGLAGMTLTTTGNAGSDALHPFDVSSLQYEDLLILTINSSGTHGDFVAVYIDTEVDITQDGASSVVSVSGTYSNLNITSNSLTTLDLSDTIVTHAGTVTLTDPTGPTSLTVNVDAETMTGITDASNHITDLTIAGTSNASSITTITDTALTSLTVTGDVTAGTSSTPLSLGVNLTTLDLSGDTNTAGTNYVTLNHVATVTLGDTNNVITDTSGSGDSSFTAGNGNNTITANSAGGNGTFTFGTGSNTLDLNNAHGFATVTIGVDGAFTSSPNTPNLILEHALATVIIDLASNVSSLTPDGSAGSVSDLVADLSGTVAGAAFDATFGGNTYIAETASGNPGAGDVTIIEITGSHTPVLLGANHIQVG